MKRIAKFMTALFAASFIFTSAFAQEAEAAATADTPEAPAAAEETAAAEAPAETPAPVPEAELPAADGMYTVFSQVFTGGAFKKIEINLLTEDFILVSSGADATTLEIRSNYKEKFPVVTQDGKTIKVAQTDKKANTLQGRKCVVKLTLPLNFPPVDFVLSMDNGTASLEPFAAGNIKISMGNGTMDIQRAKADKTISLSMGEGLLTADNIETKSFTTSAKGGNVNIKKLSAEEFSFTMDKGIAALKLAKPFTKQSSLEVGSGSITAEFPAGTVFYNTISVGKGSYRTDFPSNTKGPELKAKFGKGTIVVSKD